MSPLRTDPQTEALREVFAELVRSPAAVRRMVERENGLRTLHDTDPNAHVLTGTFFSASMNLANGKGLLFDYAGVSDVAAPWADRVRVISGSRPKTMTLLIRPDGYVAWAADQADPEGLRTALTTWFGPG